MARPRRIKKKTITKKTKYKKRRKSSSLASVKKNLSKQVVSAATLMRKIILWVLLVFILVVAVLFFSEYKDLNSAKLPVLSSTPEKAIEIKEEREEAPLRRIESIKSFEIPSGYAYGSEQILHREGFTISYNADYKIPNWVAYSLTAEKASATKVGRYKKFLPDPDVKEYTDFNSDYSANDYDRGHMVPAGDMKWSFQAMKESFYFTNICPQSQKLNGGIWADLENQCRTWAKDKKTIYIAAGPVIEQTMERMGENEIAIPKRFYKVVCVQLADGSYEGVGFLFENRPYVKTKVKEMYVPIYEVEQATGLDFFPLLPDKLEKEMESKVNESFWFK